MGERDRAIRKKRESNRQSRVPRRDPVDPAVGRERGEQGDGGVKLRELTRPRVGYDITRLQGGIIELN